MKGTPRIGHMYEDRISQAVHIPPNRIQSRIVHGISLPLACAPQPKFFQDLEPARSPPHRIVNLLNHELAEVGVVDLAQSIWVSP